MENFNPFSWIYGIIASNKKIGTVIGIDLLSIAPLKGAIFLPGCDFTSPNTLQQIQRILRRRNNDDDATTTDAITDNQVASEDNKIDGCTNEDLNHCQNANFKDSPVANALAPSAAIPEEENIGDDFLVDVVLSDMAPNATGQKETDHYRIVKLVEAALLFAIKNGKPGGHFLAKVWDGADMQKLESCVSKYYEKVSRQKPPSSRNDSAEIFLLGKFKK